jgi:hypothetical protein
MGSIPIIRSIFSASPGNARQRVPEQDHDCCGLQARTYARALPQIAAQCPSESRFCRTWGLTEKPSARRVDPATVGQEPTSQRSIWLAHSEGRRYTEY